MIRPNCEDCPFQNQLKIFGEEVGTNSKIVAVGIAPAREEVSQRRVFVGRSGIILRNTLEALEIEDYHLINCLLCQVNNEEQVEAALECCKARLVSEILEKDPSLIITLGNIPLHLLADTEYTVTEVEGRVIPSRLGIPLLPAEHPAALLRRPEGFWDFYEALRNGPKFLRGTYRQAGDPETILVDWSNLDEIKEEISKHDIIAVDLETTGFHAYGWEPEEILELGISVEPYEKAFIIPKDLIREFKEILESKKCLLWNAQFDSSFLLVLGIRLNVYWDGMLGHYSIDERPYSHGLKRVSRLYLGTDDWEREVKTYVRKKSDSYANVPTPVRHVYLAKDTTRTGLLHEVLDEDINRPVFDRLLMPACLMFIDIENRGVRIDPVKVMDMDGVLEEDLDKLERELWNLADEVFNPNSPKQVGELLYDKLGYPIDPRLGKTTNKYYLENFTGEPLIDGIIDFREMSKMKGTYVEGFARFIDRNYRIHPSVKLFGTVTGRLSSEKPSIMNVKKVSKLREIFLPEEGHYMLDIDFKRMELMWYCIYSRDETLINMLWRGENPHEIVAILAYGKDNVDKMMGHSKTVVFGRLYKRSRKSIERQVGSEVIDVLMETVDGLFPNLPNYNEDILEKLHKNGYLTSYFGRKRRFNIITEEYRHRIEKQAVNFPIQSAASDLNLLCMLYLWDMREELGIWPLWCVHDSIVIDIPNLEVIPIIKERIEEYANEITGHIVPFECDMKYGLDWSLRKE